MNFKHMLFRAASALLLVSGLGFAGCDDADPDAFLSVTRQEIEVEYTGLTTEGEMVNFELGTNRSWRATYVEEWIHLTHTEGDRGRVRIFLSIDENNTGEDRTGFIIFEGDGGTRRTIAVTQKLKVDALSVTPAKIDRAVHVECHVPDAAQAFHQLVVRVDRAVFFECSHLFTCG